MTDEVALGAEDIRELLADLGSRLEGEGINAAVYVVGGSAIALTFAGRRLTHDIDAIVQPRDEVMAIARQMASERGLAEDWLNSSAAAWIPAQDPTADVEHVGGLAIRVAPAEHLLAMKLVAGRDRDLDDIRLLAEHLGVRSPEQAADVALAAYGEGQLDMHGGYEGVRTDAAMFLPPGVDTTVSRSRGSVADEVQVSSYMRNGRPVSGYSRRKPGSGA